MITGFRIVKNKWQNSAFDGEGARLYGGRWNSKGIPCVYLASSESLAILEILVHLEKTSILEHFTLLTFEFNENQLMALNTENLPGNWKGDPAPQETADIGDEWLNSNSCLALKLPSTIVPRETNYLININHVDFAKAFSSVKIQNFELDNRLL